MIVEYPLTKSNRIQLAKAFRDVPRVDFSLECVIEGQMGKAFVDDIKTPSAYKIQTGPFFYFAGDARSNGGQEMLKDIQPYTLFMPSSEGWMEAGKNMYGERLVGFERYSLSSECLSLEHLEKLSSQSNFNKDVKQMDLAFVTQTWGQDPFTEIPDFESPSDFIERGIGYYMEKNGKTVGSAYSSLVCSRGIEVSIFVLEDYRRQGIATILAAYLIKWCLKNKMEANWDAANLRSCKLAEKLGYIPKGKYQAIYLGA